MIDTVLDWLMPLYTGSVGYVVLATLVFLDRGAFTGAFLPGELIVGIGGIAAGRGHLSLGWTLAIVIVAGVGGECLSYWLGHRYGRSIIRRLPLAHRLEQHLHRAEDFFYRHGAKTVFVGRYVSIVGTFTPFVAGMARMRFLRFLIADIVALSLWAATGASLGYFLNSQVHLMDRILSRSAWVIVTLAALYAAWRVMQNRRSKTGWLETDGEPGEVGD